MMLIAIYRCSNSFPLLLLGEFNVNDCKYLTFVNQTWYGWRCENQLLSSCSKSDVDASAAIYVRRNQHWFSLVMLNMLLHLADVFLLQFDHASAEEVYRDETLRY
jgi:hypothetical protein